jgi:hypothetical protein
MTEKPDFNFEEAIHGVLETKTALERAGTVVNRLEQLLTQRPRAFAPLAERAFRLRDRLIEDLETLEARLARAEAGADAGDGPRDPRHDLDVPLGDAVALGGQ